MQFDPVSLLSILPSIAIVAIYRARRRQQNNYRLFYRVLAVSGILAFFTVLTFFVNIATIDSPSVDLGCRWFAVLLVLVHALFLFLGIALLFTAERESTSWKLILGSLSPVASVALIVGAVVLIVRT